MRRIALAGVTALLVIGLCWWWTRQANRAVAPLETTTTKTAVTETLEPLAPVDSATATRSEIQTGSPVAKPGSYRVRLLEPLAGYVAPAEQVVDLRPGTLTDVVMRLERKP